MDEKNILSIGIDELFGEGSGIELVPVNPMELSKSTKEEPNKRGDDNDQSN